MGKDLLVLVLLTFIIKILFFETDLFNELLLTRGLLTGRLQNWILYQALIIETRFESDRVALFLSISDHVSLPIEEASLFINRYQL